MDIPSKEQTALALILAFSLISFGCSRPGDEDKQTPLTEVIRLQGTMRLERPENQISLKSALPVLTEQQVQIELRDYIYGNASDIKISARNKVWSARLSGNKSLSSKPFSISTISDNQEIQIKATRVENLLGEKKSSEKKSCVRTIELNYQCQPPQRCGPQPRRIEGLQTVATTYREFSVKYDFELSDKSGKFATIAAEPTVVSRPIKVESTECK